MTNEEKIERARLIAGVVSAVCGILGFVLGVWWLTSIALGAAIVWVGCIVLKGNATVNRLSREDDEK